MNQSDIDKYIHDIELLIPIKDEGSRQFCRYMRASIEDYLESNESSSMSNLIDEFGSPRDVAIGYIESLDSDILVRQLSRAHMIRTLVLTIIIAVLLALAVFAGFQYRSYLDAKNTVITKEQTIIVYGDDE